MTEQQAAYLRHKIEALQKQRETVRNASVIALRVFDDAIDTAMHELVTPEWLRSETRNE